MRSNSKLSLSMKNVRSQQSKGNHKYWWLRRFCEKYCVMGFKSTLITANLYKTWFDVRTDRTRKSYANWQFPSFMYGPWFKLSLLKYVLCPNSCKGLYIAHLKLFILIMLLGMNIQSKVDVRGSLTTVTNILYNTGWPRCFFIYICIVEIVQLVIHKVHIHGMKKCMTMRLLHVYLNANFSCQRGNHKGHNHDVRHFMALIIVHMYLKDTLFIRGGTTTFTIII